MEPGSPDAELRERKRSSDVANGSDVVTDCVKKLSQNGSSVPPPLAAANLVIDRHTLVLWRRPLTTLYYFVCELLIVFRNYSVR